MKIFFYSARAELCWSDCKYGGCADRFLHQLLTIPAFTGMQVLPHGSAFPPSMETPLRSGDLLLLHAASRRELDRLLQIRDTFENYRIILILATELLAEGSRYHLLNPRYIATAERGIRDVQKVVHKLIAEEERHAAHSPAIIK